MDPEGNEYEVYKFVTLGGVHNGMRGGGECIEPCSVNGEVRRVEG